MKTTAKIFSKLLSFKNKTSKVKTISQDCKNFIVKNNYGTFQCIKSSCLLFLINADDTENLFI